MFKRIRSWTSNLAHRTFGLQAKRKSGGRLSMRGLHLEPLERRELLTVSLSGSKWNDDNANGVRDAGEPGLAGWTIYVDSNQNGQLDAGEASAVTAADGSYTISGLAAGTHLVSEVKQAGWEPTTGGGLQLLQAWKDGVGGVDGLYGATGMVVSPDGAYVYATGMYDDSVAVFSRNTTTGALTFVEVKKDGVSGVDGLNEAYEIAISPDGASIYVVGQVDNAVAVFRRDATTGTLTYVEYKKDGVGGVDGLLYPADVIVSPDGAHVYVAGSNDHAVSVFRRDPTTGALTYVERKKDGVDGVDGLLYCRGLTISPDGAQCLRRRSQR